MKKTLYIVPIIAALAGCGSDVDLVKKGIMDFNKTTTVGQALDNWSSCEKKEWESFETDNGMTVVQFTCHHKIMEYMKKAKSLLSQEEQPKASYMDVVSDTQTFQFTINKDETFQISNVQTEFVWADGTKSESSQKPVEQLEAAYNNKVDFDQSELNIISANVMSRMFQISKAMGTQGSVKTSVSTQQVAPKQSPVNEPQASISSAPVIANTVTSNPSFPCEKASTFIEKSICNDHSLGKLDAALSGNYKNMIASNIGDGAVTDLKSTQKKWIAERNKCTNNNCLSEAYRKRMDEICEYPVLSGVHPSCTSSDDIE